MTKFCEGCPKGCFWIFGIVKKKWRAKEKALEIMKKCPCGICMVKAACQKSCILMSEYYSKSGMFCDLFYEEDGVLDFEEK